MHSVLTRCTVSYVWLIWLVQIECDRQLDLSVAFQIIWNRRLVQKLSMFFFPWQTDKSEVDNLICMFWFIRIVICILLWHNSVCKYLILPDPVVYWNQISVCQFREYFRKTFLSTCPILTLSNALKILVPFFQLYTITIALLWQNCGLQWRRESRLNFLNINHVEGV